MPDPKSLLRLLSTVGAVTARLPEFMVVYDQIVGTFGSADQAELKQAYADLVADNDEGHARLQAKLRAASKQ